MVYQKAIKKNKGDWKPPGIESKRAWQKYSLVEKKFNVSAYIEIAVELSVTRKETQNVK